MSTQSIEVIVPSAPQVDVVNDVTNVDVQSSGNVVVTVENGQTQQNLWVGPVQPEFSAPGIWVETGLGDGEDFTIWIEDGS